MQRKIARLLKALFPAEGHESCTNCSEEFPLDEFVWVWSPVDEETENDFQLASASGDLSDEEIQTRTMKIHFCPTCWDREVQQYYSSDCRVDYPQN